MNKNIFKKLDINYLNINFDKLPLESNRKIYMNLCEKILAENGYYLRDVNFNYLPLENRNEIYLNLCKIAIKSKGNALSFVNFDYLPVENNRKIYANLCKNVIERGFFVELANINLNYLPLENNRNFYADLCKITLLDCNERIKNNKHCEIDKINILVYYIKIDKLPKLFQNLSVWKENGCIELENLILNYKY